MFISYAQNFEDVILNRVFKNKNNGFYIDIGAHHPLHDSVTKAFYDRGWRGINIEPMREYFDLFLQDRHRDINLNIAINDEEKNLEFFELSGTGFSTLDKELATSLMEEKSLSLNTYLVHSRTLSSLFLEYVDCPVDFLKVDVEGWEEPVINSNNWQRFRPTVVIIEATFPESPEYRQTNINDILTHYNYTKVYFDGLNDFYLANENLELTQYFALPPNIFDNFQLYNLIDTKKHAKNLESIIKSRELDIQNYRIETSNLTAEIKTLKKKLIERERKIAILDNYLLDEKFESSRLKKEITKISQEREKENLIFNKIIEKFTEETNYSNNNNLNYQIVYLSNQIMAMKSSKFWKLRILWFKLKESLGLPSSDTEIGSQMPNGVNNQITYLNEQIAAMESSKFWKLRKLWFKFKEVVGLPCD